MLFTHVSWRENRMEWALMRTLNLTNWTWWSSQDIGETYLRHHCAGKHKQEIEKCFHALLSGFPEGMNSKSRGWGPKSRDVLWFFAVCPSPPLFQGNKIFIGKYIMEQSWICIRSTLDESLPFCLYFSLSFLLLLPVLLNKGNDSKYFKFL